MTLYSAVLSPKGWTLVANGLFSQLTFDSSDKDILGYVPTRGISYKPLSHFEDMAREDTMLGSLVRILQDKEG
jgi:hypothetical protein